MEQIISIIGVLSIGPYNMETIMAITYANTVDGTLYTSPPNTTVLVGKRGSVAKALSTSQLLGVSNTRYNTTVFASTVIENNDVSNSLSTGTFSELNNKPITQKITTNLAGVANDVLLTSANQPALEKSINYIQQINTRKATTAIRNGQFSIYTGKFTAGYPINQVDTFDTDNAANPTRNNPGSLYFNIGKITTTTYTKKTG